MLRSLVCAVALLPLAACGADKDGTSISINTSNGDGSVLAGFDGNGEASIDTPFFKGKVTLPNVKLDMNGVHLYPGSTIGSVNITAKNKPDAEEDGHVRVAFTSPASPAAVRDWFKTKLTSAGFTLTAEGNGLTGKTNEGEPFALDLVPNGSDMAKGVITIG
jgi:hypothetical protein